MLTKEEVDSKLKEEGVDEKLGTGVQFESAEELNSWIGNIKTVITKPKSINDYTTEEFEELMKDPQPKAKGLQAFLDKERTKVLKKVKETNGVEKKSAEGSPDEADPVISELKRELEENNRTVKEIKENLENEKKEQRFNSIFSKYTKNFEEDDKVYVKAVLKIDSSEEDIKREVDKYTSRAAKRGFNGFGIDGGGKKGKDFDLSDLSASVQRDLEKRKKV